MTPLTNAFAAKNRRLFRVFFIFALLLVNNASFCANGWQSLSPGIEYRDLAGSFLTPWSHVHVFRLSLKKITLSSMMATSFSKKLASVHEFAHHTQALLAINGGFFDNQYHPLGLRITNYEQKNPLKPISWWGIFYIKNHKAHIASPKAFKPSSRIEFAIQSGPRLLIKGHPTPLKPGIAERSALGITPDGEVLILITENAAMTTSELAQRMNDKPLFCTDALNLDGGSSTQLHANMDAFKRMVYGYSNVSDAIIVTPVLNTRF